MFGLYDTQDGLWMGNDDGPLHYEEAEIAAVAALICDRSLKQRMGRTRALPIPPHHLRHMKKRDEKKIEIDPVTALAQLEENG